MTWELWAIVLTIGFTVSLFRALGRRARSRAVRHEPVELQVTAVGLGTPQGQTLDLWLPAGTALPVHHRRMLRVPSRAEMLLVSVHTDEARVEPLANLHIGPLRQGERPVRLVELVIRISDVGKVGFAAREKATGHRIKLHVEREIVAGRVETEPLRIPTQDAPADSSQGGGDAEDLADISWHSVTRQ